MRIVNRFLESILVLLMVALVVDVVWQVLARYALNDPSSFTDELARYLLIWVGYLGAAYGTGLKIHLAIDFFSQKLSNTNLKYFNEVSIPLLIMLFAIAVFIVGGGRLVYITVVLDQRSSALGIPLGIVYAVIPLSGLLILLYSVNEIFKLKHSNN